MSVVVIPMGPMYIKKVDAKDYLLKIHRGTAFVALIYACLIMGIQWFFSYSFESRGITASTQLTEIMVWGYGLLALVFAGKIFLDEPNYAAMNKRISAYKSEQMIKTELIVGDYYKKVVSVLFLGVVIALVAIIWPIYSTVSNMM